MATKTLVRTVTIVKHLKYTCPNAFLRAMKLEEVTPFKEAFFILKLI